MSTTLRARLSTYRRVLLLIVSGGMLLFSMSIVFLGANVPRVQAASGNILYTPNLSQNPNEDASYPRVIRLTHSGSANGTLLATFDRSNYNGEVGNFPIFQSTDDGKTWSSSPISVVTDTQHPTWNFTGPTLFELPQAEGTYPAGTLLIAGSAYLDINQGQAIDVYVSTDHGYTWSYLSACTSEAGITIPTAHGIWEPDFQVDSAGNLVCYFSDERQSGNGYNQLLGHVVSTDGGKTWGPEAYDVAIQDSVQRPGMPTVVKMPNGQYMMSFEDCKGGYNADQACSVYVKASPDGDNWSPTTSLGTLAQTSDGRHLLHTPYLAWSPAGGPNGELILSGQRVVSGNDGSLTVLPESGSTLLVNTNLGNGPWSEIPAPFTINPTGGYNAGETACPAYSSPILPSASGTSLFYLAGVGISNGHCEIRYGSAGAGTLPFADSLASGTDAGWTTYGGNWSVNTGVYTDSASSPGDKSVVGSTGWTDYTVQGDVRLNGAGQAGLIVRVTNPSTGADNLNGYYVGLESTSGTFFLGKENGSWTGLRSVSMSVALNTWYHLTIRAVGCTIIASAQVAGSTNLPIAFTYTDTGCTFTSGQVGVRDHLTPASWRNISVSSAHHIPGLSSFGSDLYQLHNDGEIWKYVGPPMSGNCFCGWQQLDNNPAATAIVTDGNGKLYQLHNDGSIWIYQGPPMTGWQQVDNNPAAAAIAADGQGNLYQLHIDGTIWKYVGPAWNGSCFCGWQELDNNPAATAIATDASGHLYQLRTDGSIWIYQNTPMTGWQQLDNNPATTAIATNGNGTLYQLRTDGSIWVYQGTPMTGWQQLDNNPATTAIAVDNGGHLYQLHTDGSIWIYQNTPMTGWQQLDNNPATVEIAANGNGGLYQLHNDGAIWKYVGPPMSGNCFCGWQQLDNNPATVSLSGGY